MQTTFVQLDRPLLVFPDEFGTPVALLGARHHTSSHAVASEHIARAAVRPDQITTVRAYPRVRMPEDRDLFLDQLAERGVGQIAQRVRGHLHPGAAHAFGHVDNGQQRR